MKDWKDIVKESLRYKHFTLTEQPVQFKELFNDQNISYVQIHSTQVFGNETRQDIVGFCGICAWKDNNIKSLDGDSYTDEMLVVGYDWFTDKDGNKCLDVLVTEW